MDQTLNSSIKHFVLGELGCTCSDEVFETINIKFSPSRFQGLPGDCLIVIGNRLLVLLMSTGQWRDVSDNLEQLVSRGRQLRDSGGFNRIRFVVATVDNELAEAVLMERFAALPSSDDRIHLHIIAPEGLPVLKQETEHRP